MKKPETLVEAETARDNGQINQALILYRCAVNELYDAIRILEGIKEDQQDRIVLEMLEESIFELKLEAQNTLNVMARLFEEINSYTDARLVIDEAIKIGKHEF
jgi:hypothetical protein